METIVGGSSSTVQIGGTLFRYIDYNSNQTDRSIFHLDHSSCRWADISVGNATGGWGSRALSVIQEAADPQTLTVAPGQGASGHVTIGSGAVDFVLTGGRGLAPSYGNVTLDCYTASGER